MPPPDGRVVVDDFDVAPAKLLGAIDETVIGAVGSHDYARAVCCRLPDVDAGVAGEMLSRDLGHHVPPDCRLCQRRRDLAQQHLDDHRELAL